MPVQNNGPVNTPITTSVTPSADDIENQDTDAVQEGQTATKRTVKTAGDIERQVSSDSDRPSLNSQAPSLQDRLSSAGPEAGDSAIEFDEAFETESEVDINGELRFRDDESVLSGDEFKLDDIEEAMTTLDKSSSTVGQRLKKALSHLFASIRRSFTGKTLQPFDQKAFDLIKTLSNQNDSTSPLGIHLDDLYTKFENWNDNIATQNAMKEAGEGRSEERVALRDALLSGKADIIKSFKDLVAFAKIEEQRNDQLDKMGVQRNADKQGSKKSLSLSDSILRKAEGVKSEFMEAVKQRDSHNPDRPSIDEQVAQAKHNKPDDSVTPESVKKQQEWADRVRKKQRPNSE